MRMVSESLVCRALAWPARRLTALWSSLGRADGASVPALDYPVSELERMALDSRLLRPLAVIVAAFVRAAETASTLAWGANLTAAARRLPAEAGVRLAGIVLVTALVTHAALLQLTPERLRPGLPWTLAGLLLVFGLVMIVASGSVARAWTTWKDR
jgi:hypothetical protein